MTATLGQLVATNYAGGAKGRIYEKHTSFARANETEAWFNLNSFNPDTKNEVWYSILVHGGGSILIPESHIEPTDLTLEEFDNRWNNFYFND